MRFFKDNGLTIVLIGAFMATLAGMAIAGWLNNNQELGEHGRAAVGFLAYVGSGRFRL